MSMIDKENCYLLGKIRKTTGYSGELSISLDHGFTEDFPDISFLCLEIDGALIPFFISEAELINSRTLKVKFLDVTDQDKARRLVDCDVYVEKAHLPAGAGSKFSEGVEGFRVVDNDSGFSGTVIGLIQNPGQELLVVKDGNREVLIPVVDEIILLVNPKKKLIEVDLPDGLAELND